MYIQPYSTPLGLSKEGYTRAEWVMVFCMKHAAFESGVGYGSIFFYGLWRLCVQFGVVMCSSSVVCVMCVLVLCV